MADRDKIQERGNVEDRRGSRVVRSAGGIGLMGIAVVLAVGYFTTPDTAIELLDTMQQTQVQNERTYEQDDAFAGNDAYEVFVSTVVGSTNKLWGNAFANSGIRYQEPKLVLFRGSTTSVCGGATSQIGPHYCPADQTIYIDETFFEDLKNKLGAQGGDVAQAYVIAHEVGHHVQNLLGTTKLVEQARRKSRAAGNEASIRLELQADCFAGIRASTINELGVLEPNEIYEALDAAASVGDDNIQKRSTGVVQPESWTHGSSAQRKERFSRGYKYGDFEQCNTFE